MAAPDIGPQRGPRVRLPLLSTFLAGLQYSLVMPTIWEYMRVDIHCEKKVWLGVLVAAFTVCQAAFFPVMGVWSDRSGFRTPYCVCASCGVAGGCLYGLAGFFHSLPLALAGRALLGIGGSNRTLAPAFITRVAPTAQVTALLALNNGCSLLGVMFGPAINFLLLPINVTIAGAELNARTAAGWVCALVNMAMLLAYAFAFREPRSEARSAEVVTLAELSFHRRVSPVRRLSVHTPCSHQAPLLDGINTATSETQNGHGGGAPNGHGDAFESPARSAARDGGGGGRARDSSPPSSRSTLSIHFSFPPSPLQAGGARGRARTARCSSRGTAGSTW